MSKYSSSENFFKLACLFESSLILIAMVLGWIAGINPFENIRFSGEAVYYGLFGTALLFLMFLWLYQIETESIRQIRRALLDTLGPAMHQYHWSDLLVLAAVAGISEEILFRGVIQPWMESSWGAMAGLVGSNLIFGLVHAVTPLYAALAALVGVFLAVAMDYGVERNLLTPIFIHGAYDFLAFLVIMRSYRNSRV